MSTNVATINMERKRVTISQKRQFTIPVKFFEALGFNKEAECILRDNELIIRPININNNGEFAEQILEDLISQGYQGEELLIEFKKQQLKVKDAISSMLNDAKSVSQSKIEYSSYDDIFNEGNK